MPRQTATGNIILPDGARFVLKNLTTGTLLDVGICMSSIAFALNYSENLIATGNYGDIKALKDTKIAGSVTIANWQAEVMALLSSGMMTRYETTAGSITSIDNQTIAAGWLNETNIALELRETSGGHFIPTAAPTIASVTASSSGTLAADDDYFIVADDNSPTGFSIYFDTTGTATVATTESIVIAYTSATAQAGQMVYAGTNSLEKTSYGIVVIHRDSTDAIDYYIELYSATTDSGFSFDVKPASDTGLREYVVSFTGDLDYDKSDGEQLFRQYLPQ